MSATDRIWDIEKHHDRYLNPYYRIVEQGTLNTVATFIYSEEDARVIAAALEAKERHDEILGQLVILEGHCTVLMKLVGADADIRDKKLAAARAVIAKAKGKA